MDYDDNESHSQNCHIGSEGSSKFSSVLHPFVPKFDFDDGLQGHLRFDSLVENEGFLAISSQEDNQWIEDFSRGSGGLVFSSSAPEPCPIFRSNNVWSEATSSESVEMLLKSVGQEEIATVVEELNACQKLGSVAEQMEFHLKEDDNTVNVMDSNLTLHSEKITDHGSVLKEVEGVSSSPGVEVSKPGGSRLLSSNDLSETCGVDSADDNLGKRLGEENLTIVCSSTKYSDNGMQDPSGYNIHTEAKNSTSQDIIVNTVCSDNQESATIVTDVGFASASCSLTDSVNEAKEDDVLSKKVQADEGNLSGINLKELSCSSSDSEIVELHPVKINANKLDEPSGFTVIGSSDLQMSKECGDVFALKPNKGSECEHVYSSNLVRIHQQFDENIQDHLPKDFQGDGDLVAHVIEVGTKKAESSSVSDLEMCPTAEVANSSEKVKVLLGGSEYRLDTEVSISNYKVNMVSDVDNKVSDAQGDGTSISFVVEHSNVASKTSIQEEEHSVKKSKFGDDASVVLKGSSAEDHGSSPTVHALASDLNSVRHGLVVSSNMEEKLMIPNDSSEIEYGIIKSLNHEKGVGLSFNGESSKVNSEAVHGSECAAAARIEPDTLLLYERGVDDDIAADDTRQSTKMEKAVSVEPDLMRLTETSKSTDKMDPVLEIEKDLTCNITERLSQEAVDNSFPEIGTLNTASESERTGVVTSVSAGQSSPVAEIPGTKIQAEQTEKTHQISENYLDKSVLFPTVCDPTNKQNSDTDALDTSANYIPVGRDNRLASSEISDSDVLMPTISSCNVLNESKGEKEKLVEKSLVKSTPLAGSVGSAFEEARQSDVAKDSKSFTFEVHLPSGVVGQSGQDKQFFPATQPIESCKEASPLTPSFGPVEPKTVLEPPGVCSQALDLEISHGGSTGTPARRRGRPSGKAPGKQNAKKRNSLKETTPFVQSERGDNKSSVSTSLTGTGRLKFEGVKLHEKFEHSNIVSRAGAPVVIPSLPDLNTSASSSALFWQPFLDIQQMQLRAQIFVYGSLIQGSAPDETCMVAAFGTSDGGRSMWEPVWRACVERLQSVKSNLSKSENPLQPQSGSNTPEQSSTKKDALQSSVLPSPIGPGSSKDTPSPVVNAMVPNAMIPLSSPLWNISTPFHGLQSTGLPRSNVFDYRQTLSPSLPFLTPPSRNVAGNNSSWPSLASFPVPWITASQSFPFDASAHLPTTETVKLTSIKESVPPVASGAKHSFPSTTVHHSGPSFSIEPYTLPDMEKTTLTSGQEAAEPKSRRRKKSSASENLTQFPLLSQARAESVPASIPLLTQVRTKLVPAPVVPHHSSTSVVASTAAPSQSSPFDSTAYLPTTETVNLIHIKDSGPPVASGAKHLFPCTTVHHSSPCVSIEPYPLPDMEKTTLPSGQKTTELKSRRKKSSASENLIQIPLFAQDRTELVPVSTPLVTQARTELVPAPVIPGHLFTSFFTSTASASLSSPFDNSARLPTTETVNLTPIKESVQPVASGAKHTFPSTIVHHSGPSVSVQPYPMSDMEKITLPSQKTAEPKSRKRKKNTASENLIQIPLLVQSPPAPAPVPLPTQARIGLVPGPVVPSHLSTSVVVSTSPFFGSKGNDAGTVTTASPTYVTGQPKSVESSIEQMSNLPKDALINARQQAENAAALAAGAVSHSQTVWDQLNKSNNFGLIPEVEAKLASAAVAVAAAAAVAKAATAAAQLASNAASQAKMMADEAWISSGVDNPSFNNASFMSNMGNNMGLVTNSSSFKVGDEGNFSNSILVAAKETARKRVEAASFASKRAENLDAIVKAAELATAAVSQAGRIVAIGDLPSLAKLVEAGPEGYWRMPQAPLEQVNGKHSDINIIQEAPNVSGKHVNDKPKQKKAKSRSHGVFPLSRDVFKDSTEDAPCVYTSSERDSRAQRDSRASDLNKTMGAVPELASGSGPTSVSAEDFNEGVETLKGAKIKEGCLVEVKKEGGRFKEAWFSANVLSMENGKAFVSYAGSESDFTNPKEWVALDGDGDNAPRIRIAQLVTDKPFEGTRKRRRGAVEDCEWSVGDKVDVWMQECWREGIVTDKNKIDATTLTVQFPAEGETSVVRAWHLRPSLIWKDGEWVESSSSRQRDPLHKSDTPQEKRLKLDGPSMEGSKKDEISNSFRLPGPERPEELQLLPLSDKEKMFNAGNSTIKENKLDAPTTVLSRPRVVFGVPKPGKKKKFMEVSKHYITDNSNKTDKLREKKEKQLCELQNMVPKPGKPISSFGRTLPQKGKFPRSALPTKSEARKSANADGSELEKQKRSECGSVSATDGAARGPFVFSSSALSRNMFKPNAKPDRVKRGNQGPISGQKAKHEAKDNLDPGKQITEVSEPRRSNRRIQPTSRLLEGLQSSLVLPKFPSFAHDKGQRSRNRGTPKGK